MKSFEERVAPIGVTRRQVLGGALAGVAAGPSLAADLSYRRIATEAERVFGL